MSTALPISHFNGMLEFIDCIITLDISLMVHLISLPSLQTWSFENNTPPTVGFFKGYFDNNTTFPSLKINLTTLILK